MEMWYSLFLSLSTIYIGKCRFFFSELKCTEVSRTREKSMPPVKVGAKMLSLCQRAPAGCGLLGGIEGAALVQDKEIVTEMAALVLRFSHFNVQSLQEN